MESEFIKAYNDWANSDRSIQASRRLYWKRYIEARDYCKYVDLGNCFEKLTKDNVNLLGQYEPQLNMFQQGA